MDKRLEGIYNNLDNLRIGINDEFDFKCRGCGKCCRNRHDILLNPKDVFKIAKHLGITNDEVVRTYCDAYIGPDSRIPLVRLLPVGGNNRCPFLDGRKCLVHESKPVVCALFPIGRMLSAPRDGSLDDTDAPMVIEYLNNRPDCEHKHRTQTVREWLKKWGLSHPDPYFLQWHGFGMKLSKFARDLESRGATKRIMEMIMNIMFEFIYIRYDTALEFEPQFDENTAQALKLAVDTAKKAEKYLPQPEAGDSDGE